MTATPAPIVDEAEGLIRTLARSLTRPRPAECLCCYVLRMVDEYRCDGTHRHAQRFRDAMAPRATALEERLGRVGACCCDCELFLNGYQLLADRDAEEVEVADGVWTDPPPAPVPPCAGVRRGSLRPCANWVRQRRW